jgi:hypothetical protein
MMLPRRHRRRSRSLALVLLLAAGATWQHPAATTARAQDAPDAVDVQQQVGELLAAGNYAALVEATAGIEKTLRVKSRDPAYAPKMRLLTDLLLRRAFAERRLGRLDAVDASLDAAAKTIGDKELQRLIVMFMRSAGEGAVPTLVPLELTNLEVVDARLEVLLDRIDAAAGRAGDTEPAPVDPRGEKGTELAKELVKQARTLREGLPERLDQADPAVQRSPYARMLASQARPLLQAARLALVAARGAGGAQPAPAPARPAGGNAETDAAAARVEGPRTAVELCVEALAAADAAIAPAIAPPPPPRRGQPAAPPADLEAARGEAALARAPLVEWLARARFAAGDTTAARADAEAALAERAMAGQESHPDVVEGLVLLGEIALAEARAAATERRVAESTVAFTAAVDALSRARAVIAAHELQFAPASPLRRRVDTDLPEALAARAGAAALVSAADAVDAAAGRALRALRPAVAADRAAVPEAVPAGE